MSESITLPMIAVAGGASLAAAILDIRSYRVPNWLTLPLLAAGLAVRLVVGGLPGLGDALAGAAFGFGALIWVHAMGGMGAGDVKLAAAIGAWLGLALTARVLFWSALSGGAFALLLAIASGRLFEVLASVPIFGPRLMGVPPSAPIDRAGLADELRRPDRRTRVLPFAAMIAAGLAIAVATA